MSVHVAILKPQYLRLILAGRKTIESRLTLTAQPPFLQVSAGERLFFKQSGGPFGATALARQVESFANVTRDQMRRFYTELNERIQGDREHWVQKRDANFATFIHLRDIEPLDVGPDYGRANMKAWFVLDDADTVLLDVPLTGGAIRNGWVRVPTRYRRFPTGPATLLMPDGELLESQINARRHIGGRGWRRYHSAYGVQAGDAVRLVVVGEGRYRVSFVKRHE